MVPGTLDFQFENQENVYQARTNKSPHMTHTLYQVKEPNYFLLQLINQTSRNITKFKIIGVTLQTKTTFTYIINIHIKHMYYIS